jgi:CHAT domain-containing protein
MAPFFHRLCLAPGGGDDGEFYAYELLGMDLRGLELVTLSACETALGRFDAADNPHGLPAALLLAGAQTIIGTLWEIETNCSELFFTTLYGELARPNSKLGAFHEALRVTREQYPQFRDWGGFYFAGGWR